MHVHARAFESDLALVAILASDASVFSRPPWVPYRSRLVTVVILGRDQGLMGPDLTVD